MIHKNVAGSLVIFKKLLCLVVQVAQLFESLGGALSARTPMFQNLFGGKQVRTKSGALEW